MVSSEDEFISLMSADNTKRKSTTVPVATINKLGMAARKYKDSNQMNKLLNAFFVSIKNETAQIER
jgi:hypothetical protein